MTVVPLLLFGAAARSIPLSAVGILLYINPLIQFAVGAFVFDEVVTPGRFAGFAVIWIGLGVFAFDGWCRRPDRTAVAGAGAAGSGAAAPTVTDEADARQL